MVAIIAALLGVIAGALAWRLKSDPLDFLLFGAASFVLLLQALVQFTVGMGYQPNGIIAPISIFSSVLIFPLGLLMGIRGVFFAKEKFAKWASIGGCLLLFLLPALLAFTVLGMLTLSGGRS